MALGFRELPMAFRVGLNDALNALLFLVDPLYYRSTYAAGCASVCVCVCVCVKFRPLCETGQVLQRGQPKPTGHLRGRSFSVVGCATLIKHKKTVLTPKTNSIRRTFSHNTPTSQAGTHTQRTHWINQTDTTLGSKLY